MRIRDWSSDVCSSDLKWQSPLQAVDGLNIQPIETAGAIENKELRKREQPYLMPLNAGTVRAVEKASYDGAYKGVTDILTLYLWRGAAFHLTRRSEEHTSELQSLMRISYAVFCLKKKNNKIHRHTLPNQRSE